MDLVLLLVRLQEGYRVAIGNADDNAHQGLRLRGQLFSEFQSQQKRSPHGQYECRV